MEQQHNTLALNDSAGVLPMDTGVTYNGVHDESMNNPSSSGKTGTKKGRGRPPKSGSTTKGSSGINASKRGRGRPPKTGETSSSTKKVTALNTKKEETSTNVDVNKKRRGRPSKSSTSNEQINGISKPQVRVTPVSYQQEKQVVDEPIKRKRGRPSGTPKKTVVAAVSTPSKTASSGRKRGRPSGSGSIKKSSSKPKASVSTDGSARKRGRPKKSTGTPSTTGPVGSVNETATVTTNNVQ
ncbi:unnamed protein product [Rotaria sordida]|uniref:Uncharacterized protein n=1 Tax=Rotaria sordida TaxID=392033 RepID=A0A813XJ06_9BILA|nr:unnamed protein product [Rotaria sordida]CAF0882980.1 unnamed protein product [Rotaria sordida]CAF0901927.1 unnamed protein product [Rotaria sordida]CAF0936907.1 unnamed protein product [Rotaria sordida]CAF0956177.1 unnamed protein product [Rotaria sordida]